MQRTKFAATAPGSASSSLEGLIMKSPFIAAEEARSHITNEHAVLRSLCRALVDAAQTAVLDENQGQYVRDVLDQLCTEIEKHLDYEERVLIPILRDADAWGPVRVEQLSKEHAEQRAFLFGLLEDAQEGMRDIGALADEIICFAARFEQDMEEEEERLLNADALGERMVVVDQIDG
jgi:hemerythrin-like domain-containing protein